MVKRPARPKADIRPLEAISVVIIVRNQECWVEEVLPVILMQKCDEFEVVIVDMGENDEVSSSLMLLKNIYPHLVISSFVYNQQFPISNKMAYNVGIKSSSSPNILLSTTDVELTSESWLLDFANAFRKSDVVLGYQGLSSEANAIFSRLIRLSGHMDAVKYLSSAIGGRPFYGALGAYGFRRELYFSSKGFNFLNMNIGENDLFIQKITTANNTSIIVNKHSKTIEDFRGGYFDWRENKRYWRHTVQFYPKLLRINMAMEGVSRMLFFVIAAVAITVLPPILKIIVVGVLLLRLSIVYFSIRAIAHRVDERGFLSVLPIYDIISPLADFLMYVGIKFKPMTRVWR